MRRAPATDQLQLRTLGHATAYECDVVGGVGVEVAEMGLDLHGQFASGQQNQRGCRTGFGLGQLFQNRNDEAECLAGAGLGSGEHILALERWRNCAGLNRGGGSEIERGDALLERVGDLKV
jgi:hypothetical protein